MEVRDGEQFVLSAHSEPGKDLKSVTLKPDEILEKTRGEREKKKFLKVCKGKTPQ